MRYPLARELEARRAVVDRTPVLDQLARRLENFLTPLMDGPIYLPSAKALLSRDGGVCPDDGARLAFHPLEPLRHGCPRCGRTVEGERHHRAWVVRYHVWLSERAIHGALLGSLRGNTELTARAAAILAAYAAHYHDWPNRDNVLGPSRPFFSTYLEAVWLTQLALAGAMVRSTGAPLPGGVREMFVASSDLIRSFPEGLSNRQAWNATALIAAGVALEDDALVEEGYRGASGLERLLAHGVGAEGFWHEGENYHLFALRGLALGAEVLRWATGTDLYAAGPLRGMFAAPLATLLPDLTLPARGDAPYGVSVCQPRFAELWEWGRARGARQAVEPVLTELYDPRHPEAPDEGWRELAEQEQNRPAHRQHRARLGWKALLWMDPEPPAGGALAGGPGVTVLADQGICVLRPAAGRYVSIESGRRRGGHQHPDLPHVSMWYGRPILADFGTASYVVPSLHWYRSAEAHNVPGLPGVGQPGNVAWCATADHDASWAWARVVAPDLLGTGTEVRRMVICGPDFVVDVVDVEVGPGVTVELSVHPLRPGMLRLVPRPGEDVLERLAPGPPGPDFADGAPLSYTVRRATGSGRWIQVLDPAGVVLEAGDGPAIRTAEGRWRFLARGDVLLVQRDARQIVRLAGATSPPVRETPRVATPQIPVAVPRLAAVPSLDAWPDTPRFRLAGPQYRRSEVPYDALPDAFAAEVALGVHDTVVAFRVSVRKDQVDVRPAGTSDPALDNESADIHSDGVQCYVGRDDWTGWVVLPDVTAGSIRARAVEGTAARAEAVRGTARRTPTGYEVLVLCDTGRRFAPGDTFRFNVVVNEMRPGRERRQGQLAFTGGGWVYLRGDREPAGAAAVAEVR